MLNEHKVGQYRIGERTLYLRPLKGKQMQQFHLFKGTKLADIMRIGQSGFELIGNLEFMANLFSIGLTDEAGACVTVTAAEIGETELDVIAEVWNDFFLLYPKWTPIIIAWFVSTLNLVEEKESRTVQAGAGQTSGSTSSQSPAVET